MTRFCVLLTFLATFLGLAGAFQLSKPSRSALTSAVTRLSSTALTDVQASSFVLSDEQVKPIIRLGKGDKEMVINAHGMWCAAVSLITAPIWSVAMSIVAFLNKMNEDWDPTRSIYDMTGKMWSRTWLSMINSYPTFSGEVELIRESQGPCLYVANHASWLDIPVLCTVLDPVFKFIAKGELRKVPCIGQQLAGGNHILIDRDDRKSQLRTFKHGITWLRKGVPIMAFPEGRRSKDGKLMEFKGGLFSMAVKTKVPIIPITISHAHAVMPCNALFPVQSGAGKLHVHVHKAIDTLGRSDTDLAEAVRAAFLSSLPYEQHPDLTTIDVATHVPSIPAHIPVHHAHVEPVHHHVDPDHVHQARIELPISTTEEEKELLETVS